MNIETNTTAEAGSATVESGPTRQDILYAYREWLHFEGRLLGLELFSECGSAAVNYIPLNTLAANFHFPVDEDWQTAKQPSTRAESVLRLVGVLPAEIETGRTA